MSKKIRTTRNQALDGTASVGNLHHWGWWCAALEMAIEDQREPEKPLTNAASYVAWLLLSSEHIAYRLRWYLYARRDLKEAGVFDFQYEKLLQQCKTAMPADVHMHATFVVGVRHILVHKGFPNLQEAPAARPGGTISESEFRAIRDIIKIPSNYRSIKDRFDAVHSWLNTGTPGVEFGI